MGFYCFMCGIAGILNLNNRKVDPSLIQEMVMAQRHRGPDGEGYFTDGNIGLGHCRLAIIDLSSDGHQPMASEDGNFWITYNGEVYNYLELKDELKKHGHNFKSNTDTEVILHSYREWGVDCLNKFNGMWAFAIWDIKKKELFCSRDRFGVKPFYYYFDGKIFAFASEIKAILALEMRKEPNDVLIYDFLKFGILDHTNETFFRNIKKLPPASWLKTKQNGQIVIKKYWDFKVSNDIRNKNSDQKCAQKFYDLFADAVKLRLRSDVTVGSCLSGGLDSSSIVCVVNKFLKKENIPSIGEKQKTFSSCFEEKNFDERKYIKEVIKITGAEKNFVFPRPENFLKEIDELLWHQEEPFAGPGVYAQWLVMKTAKKKVKVLLDGQGGDENLGGYRKFYIFYLRKLLENREYFSFFNEFLRFFSSLEVLKTLNVKSGLRYFGLGNKVLNIEKVLNRNFLKKFRERHLEFGYKINLGQRVKEDITIWSLPVLLRYEDKNSMANSIEARLPFLDYRLVEKIASFPLNQKMRNGWTKVVLRNTTKGILPEKVRLRKSKLGFSTPEDIWIKKDLFENIRSVIQNSIFLPNYINKEELLKIIDKFSSNRAIFTGSMIFRFYILELWGRKFLDIR